MDHLDFQSLHLVLYKVKKFDNSIINLVFIFNEEDPIVVKILFQNIDVPIVLFLKQ